MRFKICFTGNRLVPNFFSYLPISLIETSRSKNRIINILRKPLQMEKAPEGMSIVHPEQAAVMRLYLREDGCDYFPAAVTVVCEQ